MYDKKTNYTFRSLAVITLAAFFLFYKYILQVSPSVMSHELMSAFSLNGAGLGFMAACYFYTYMILQIPAGLLLDRFGLRLLLTITITVAAIGGVIFSQTSTVWAADVARGLIGAGAAFGTTGYMKAVNNWAPRQHLAIFSGLFGTACMLGATFASSPIAILVTHLGWRQTMLLVGALGIILALCVGLFVRNGAKEKSEYTSSGNFLSGLKAVLCTRNNWPLLVFNGIAFAPVAVYGGLWGAPFLEQTYHVSRTHAAFSASLIFFGLAVGGPILGWLSDHFHHRKRFIYLGTVISLICLLLMLYLPGHSMVTIDVLTFLTGLGLSSFLISYTMALEYNSVAHAATVIAVINTGSPIFGAIAEPLIGHLLDNGWHGKVGVHGVHIFSTADYHQALIVLPIYLLIALVAMWLVKEHTIIKSNEDTP